MSLLEQWLNSVGGNVDLKPKTPSSTPASQWLENARNTAKPPQVPTSSGPSYNTTPPNVAGKVEKLGTGTKPNWVFGGVSSGQQVVPYSEPKVPAVASKSAGVPEIKPPSIAGKVLRGAKVLTTNPLVMALTPSKLGIPEHDQSWIDQQIEKGDMPEGSTPNTIKIQNDIWGLQSDFRDDFNKQQSSLESKIQVLEEAGASPDLIQSAKEELNSLQMGDPLEGYVADKLKDLAETQAYIDAVSSEVGYLPEVLKSRLEGSGMLERKRQIEADLADVQRVIQYQSEQLALAKNVIPEEHVGDVNKIIQASGKTTEDEVKNSLDPKTNSKVQDIANDIVNNIEGGDPPAEAIRKESSFLGDLFGDKNIQRALVYYLGARLMGYSSSGSGMAAGEVLLAGMEDSAEAEKLRLESEAEAAAKNAIDMSKVVDMVNYKGEFVKSYVSPNGKFFRPVNEPEDVAYRVSTTGYRMAKTGEKDRNTRIIEVSDKVRDKFGPSIMKELKDRVKSDVRPDGYEQQNIDIAGQAFSEAGIADQLVSNLVDSYGLRYLESREGQQALRKAMGQFAKEVASGAVVNIASAQGQFDRMMMKASIEKLPREIYMLDGNMVSSDAQNKLSNRIRDIHAVRSVALERLYERKDLTDKQVRQREVMIDKLVRFENVLQKAYEDFNKRKSNKRFNTYWTNIAKNNKSTPFIEWVTDKAETGKEFNSFSSLTVEDENYFSNLLGLSEQSTKKE